MNESINRIESNHSDQFHVQIEAMMQRHHIPVHDMMLAEIIDECIVQVYLSSLMAFHALRWLISIPSDLPLVCGFKTQVDYFI